MMVGFITSMTKPGSGARDLRPCKSWTDQVWERYERITGEQRPAIFRRPKEE